MSINPPSASSFGAFNHPIEGMRRATRLVEEAARGIAGGEVTSARMVDMIKGERMFEANASVMRTQDEMIGTLLNVKR